VALLADFDDTMDLARIDARSEALDAAVRDLFPPGTLRAGHSGELQRARKLYAAVAALPCVKCVCEVGFNVGHSTIVWLDDDRSDRTVVSFDFFDSKASEAGVRFLDDDRLTVVPGNSAVTLPAFADAASSSSFRCDLLVVDGGHSIADARSDLTHMRRLANPAFHLLLVDDIFCASYHCIGPTAVANDMIHAGLLSPPLLAFTEHDGRTPDARGLALFQYRHLTGAGSSGGPE